MKRCCCVVWLRTARIASARNHKALSLSHCHSRASMAATHATDGGLVFLLPPGATAQFYLTCDPLCGVANGAWHQAHRFLDDATWPSHVAHQHRDSLCLRVFPTGYVNFTACRDAWESFSVLRTADGKLGRGTVCS